MQRRRLGGLEVSAVDLGCATMTPFYDEPDRDAAIETLRRAHEIGVDFLDSSDAYGRGRNEELIARGVEGHRDEYVIASKFGNLRAPDGSPTSDGRSGVRQGVLRAQPEAARNRCHRPLLHPSCRSDCADRGHGRRNERRVAPRQRYAISAFPRPARRRSGAPTRSIR